MAILGVVSQEASALTIPQRASQDPPGQVREQWGWGRLGKEGGMGGGKAAGRLDPVASPVGEGYDWAPMTELQIPSSSICHKPSLSLLAS